MPLTIASIFTFIPSTLWTLLTNFLKKDAVVSFDLAFRLSTKYTPALLTVGICLSFANQFVRNLEIDCITSGVDEGGGGSGGGRRSGSAGGHGGVSDLNDYCWNHDTFLVVKALEPEMQGEVSHPGVSGYRRDRDRVVRQRYYKFVWMIFGKMAVFSFLPYFFWKVRGNNKMKPLLAPSSPTEEISEDDIRVKYFLETVGFNDCFARCYFLSKVLATLTPVGEFFYLCGIIGPSFAFYGVETFIYWMNATPWPDPMDALFPKMAKCNWIKYGFGGDPEIKSAICQLPMNNLTQWSFWVFWWWLAFTFGVNLLFLGYDALILIGPYRKSKFISLVARACREDVEKARGFGGMGNKKRFKKKDVIGVELSFGDVLVLSFIKLNMEDWAFRDFIRTLVITKNHVLQLKPGPTRTLLRNKDKNKDHKTTPPLEMGFIIPNSLLGVHNQLPGTAATSPMSYSDQSTDTIETTDGSQMDDQTVMTPTSPYSPPSPGWSIPIKNPVNITRQNSSSSSNLSSRDKNKGKSPLESRNRPPVHPPKNKKPQLHTSTPKNDAYYTSPGGDGGEDWS